MTALLSRLAGPLTAVGLCATAFAGGYAYGRLDGRALAEKAVIQQIVDQNERAGHDAETCRERYRMCADAGGLFDFADCSCVR